MTNIFVDTDILIDYSKGKDLLLQKLLTQQVKNEVELYVNPVVIAEFFTDIQLKNPPKNTAALELFSYFTVSEITAAIGYRAGELLRDKTMEFIADALIAAACLEKKLTLATRNKKHFQKVPELQLYSNN